MTFLMEPRISLKRRKSRETDPDAAAIVLTEINIKYLSDNCFAS